VPVFTDPPRSELFIHFAGSNTQDQRDYFRLCCVDLVPVATKEHVRREERDALVSVDEPMVLRKAVEISRCYIVDGRIAVSGFVSRSGQSGLDRTAIPDAGAPPRCASSIS
jgi:hypothetical protein